MTFGDGGNNTGGGGEVTAAASVKMQKLDKKPASKLHHPQSALRKRDMEPASIVDQTWVVASWHERIKIKCCH